MWNSDAIFWWLGVANTTKGEAIMLVKLSNSHNLVIMLTDFTYYSQNYAWFNARGITDD